MIGDTCWICRRHYKNGRKVNMFNKFCAYNITYLAVAVFVLRYVTSAQRPHSSHSLFYCCWLWCFRIIPHLLHRKSVIVKLLMNSAVISQCYSISEIMARFMIIISSSVCLLDTFPCYAPCTCNRCTIMRIIQKLKIQNG